jgi:uncharacterized OB-fold protein
VQEGIFGEDADGTAFLVGGRCDACSRVQFPMAPTCPACGGDAVTEIRLSDHGTLWGWTAVTAPPPGYLGEVPYGFGVVELPEGLRVITRLEEPDPTRLEFGMPMQLVIAELGPDPDADDPDTVVTTYSFTATGAT